MGGPYGLNSQPILPWLDSGENPQFPFLAALDIPDIHKLTNDPINHNSLWPPVPHKIPSDIPKFDGKQGDDPAAHITTLHLWSISNSMVDDSVWLRLFPHTLIGNAAKWYIELPRAAINTFGTLATEFLKNFQLPIRFETGMELLTSLCQGTATHISNHIHE